RSANQRNLTFRATGGPFTLTLGGDITNSTVVNETMIFGSAIASGGLNVNLGGTTRTLTARNGTSGRGMTFEKVAANGGIVADVGSGTLIAFNAANTYTGDTTVKSGILSLNGAIGSSADSNFTVKGGGAANTQLQFNSTTNGNVGTIRANSVAIDGS